MGSQLGRNRILITDLFAISISIWLAYVIRLSGDPAYYEQISMLVFLLFIGVPLKVLVLYLAGIYRVYWRYLDANVIWKLVISTYLAWMVFILLFASFPFLGLLHFPILFPRSIFFLDLLISFPLLLIGRKVAYLQVTS